jgi:hypothetical protein
LGGDIDLKALGNEPRSFAELHDPDHPFVVH